MSRPLYVWGVDPGANAWHVACAPAASLAAAATPPPSDVVTRSWRSSERPESAELLSDLYALVYLSARRLAKACPPLIIWVEQPTGRVPHPHLMAAWGVIRCALYDAFATEGAAPVSVHTLTPSVWKLAAVGHGNASIPTYTAWASQLAERELPEDQAAAFGVMLAGARQLSPESLLAAA